MKTQKNNSLQVITKITFLVTLLMVVSCKSKEDSKNSSTSVAQTEVAPPQIDIHAAVVKGNLDALKQHIAAGSNLNEKDPFGGSSPLITAALFDKREMAKVLLDAGAEIDFQNNDGSTALYTAAFFCRKEIVQLLLDRGADKIIKNKYGSTAYESVAGPFSEMKNTYEIIEKMLAPMGLKLDYAYIEKTRPEIAAMLK